MAKSTTSSKRKVAVFSVKGWDAQHYKTTDQYAKAVEKIMSATTADIARIVATNGKIDDSKEFKFADYPLVQKQVAKAIKEMAGSMTQTIEKGSRKEWLQASKKGDAFLASIMDTSKVSKARLQKMQDKNLDALSAFQSRKVDGMNLSQRVWKYADQYKNQLEQCIDVGLGEGRSADELSRDVRKNLKDPNRLFRRVKDKRGNLVLSKNARAFHPGQGVYRSSYKNAMRLTRSEINMAYRESDYLRWQQLDFVIGIEIHRSNHEPLCECKLCDRLRGKYPKTFKFKGWHPQCMCYATPILVSDDEFDAQELSDLKSALHGTEYKKLAVKGEITDVPDGFKEWVQENMEASKDWKSTPYFVKDNFVDGELGKGLNAAASSSRAGTATQTEVVEPAKRAPFDELDDATKADWREFINNQWPLEWDMKRALARNEVDYSEYEQHLQEAKFNNEYWRKEELMSERNALMSKLNAKIAASRAKAVQLVDDFEVACKEYINVLGNAETTDYVRRGRDRIVIEDRRFNNFDKDYSFIIIQFSDGTMSIAHMRQNATYEQNRYNNVITVAKDAITKYENDTDVSNLKKLVDEPLSGTRPAVVITKELEMEIKKVENGVNGLQPYIDELSDTEIAQNEVTTYEKQPDEDTLINDIGGGDLTRGSCSSLAFAWAANRGGMHVLDFRGGESQKYFSSTRHIRQICEAVGGINEHMTGIQAMRKTEIGKEYYLAIGSHAAIVRQTSPKNYQYLELQSGVAGRNGWHKLNSRVFSSRFGARGTESAQLIDVELLYHHKDYKKLMGYINTAESEQEKGESGTIR